MSTGEMFLLPVIEPTDWETLQQTLAAVVELPQLTEEEEADRERLAYGRDLDERAAAPAPPPDASIAAEAEYRAVATPDAPEVTEYMESAFVLAEGQSTAEVVQWIMFAPTFREARELLTAFVSEDLILNEKWYHDDLLSRWWKREIGLEPGKTEWLAAIDIKPQPYIPLARDEEDAEVARQKLANLLAPPASEKPEAPAEPATLNKSPGPATPFTVAAGQLVKVGECRRKQKLAERRLLEGEGHGRGRKPRYREAGIGDEEAVQVLQRAIKSWTPEMISWALYHAQIKILGIQISAVIKNPLLSVEEKKERIQEAKAGGISPLLIVNYSQQEEIRKPTASNQNRAQHNSSVGPASPWPRWPHLQLVETELLPIYQLLGSIRTEFRLAEAWAEIQRGPQELRGRVETISDRATGPIWVITDADRRATAIFKAARVASAPPEATGHQAKLAAARKLSELARHALGDVQKETNHAVKEKTVAEAQYLVHTARKAERKLSCPLPGAATGNRRRATEKRLPLLKAARLRRKAKAHKAPVAENKARRKKDRAA